MQQKINQFVVASKVWRIRCPSAFINKVHIFTLLLSYVLPVKSKVKILQNFVAFSEYMNFNHPKSSEQSRDDIFPKFILQKDESLENTS